MDQSDMILAQLPIVLSLLLLVYQAYKTFEIKEFLLVFYGFLMDLIYLLVSFLFHVFKINDASIISGTQVGIVLFSTSFIDMFSMLFFSIASLNFLFKGKLKPYIYSIFYIVLILSVIIRIIPDNPDKDLVPFIHMRYFPYSIMSSISLFLLAALFFNVTNKNMGSILLVSGTILWAIIQFIGVLELNEFKELYSDDRIEIFAFGLGFLSKTIILIGIFRYIIKVGIENANRKEIASKLDLIFGVSFHEFSHPLRGIKVILQEMNPEDESKAPSYIGHYKKSFEKIDEHYNHLLAIITASIKMYASDTGKLIENEFYNKVSNSDSTVTDSINTIIQIVVLSMKASTAREEAEKIKFNFNLGGNCIVSYDHNQMFQVFQNLFKNSKEAFKNQNGTVYIKTRICNNKKDNDKIFHHKEIIIDITDDGPGIDFSIAKNVFNAGFSTKSSTGRGLGLAIAKRLVEANSGRLELVIPELITNERIPAHFRITLPKS